MLIKISLIDRVARAFQRTYHEILILLILHVSVPVAVAQPQPYPRVLSARPLEFAAEGFVCLGQQRGNALNGYGVIFICVSLEYGFGKGEDF